MPYPFFMSLNRELILVLTANLAQSRQECITVTMHRSDDPAQKAGTVKDLYCSTQCIDVPTCVFINEPKS